MDLNNQIIIYQTEDGQMQIDVRLENETVWLTQAQMAELFETDRTSIVRHINNIYKVEELDRESICAKKCTCSFLEHMDNEGKGRSCRIRKICEYHSAWCKGCYQSDKQE